MAVNVSDSSPSELSSLLEKIEQTLDELDVPFSGKLQEDLEDLRRLLTEKRPPRLALMGRRGSGKSSLINAIFGEQVADIGHEGAMTGEASWWEYMGELGTIEVLDTRGFQEGSGPEQADEADSAKASIKRALGEQRADAIIFLVKATEVDAAIDDDVEALHDISSWLEDRYGHQPPIVGVATHCDVLEPKNVELHRPSDWPECDIEEKKERVRTITADLSEKLSAKGSLSDQLVKTIGVSSYMSWRDDGTLRSDDRWNIDALSTFLVHRLPEQAVFELARVSQVQFLQRRLAKRIVNATSTVTGALGAAPTPLADLIPITSAQVAMITSVGYLSGRDMSADTARDFMGAMGVNLGAAYGFREAARALVQLIPAAGQAISGAVAYAGTYGLGQAAIAYFIDGQDQEEAQHTYEQQKEQAREKGEAKYGTAAG